MARTGTSTLFQDIFSLYHVIIIFENQQNCTLLTKLQRDPYQCKNAVHGHTHIMIEAGLCLKIEPNPVQFKTTNSLPRSRFTYLFIESSWYTNLSY